MAKCCGTFHIGEKEWYESALSNIFIAAIAIENDLSIYTLDNHFTQISNLKLYKE